VKSVLSQQGKKQDCPIIRYIEGDNEMTQNKTFLRLASLTFMGAFAAGIVYLALAGQPPLYG